MTMFGGRQRERAVALVVEQLTKADLFGITQMLVDERDCGWCTAKAGELCWPDPVTLPKSLERTHLIRLAPTAGEDIEAIITRYRARPT